MTKQEFKQEVSKAFSDSMTKIMHIALASGLSSDEVITTVDDEIQARAERSTEARNFLVIE